MFRPPAYAVDETERIAAAMRAHPLATLIVNGQEGPQAAYAPLVMTDDGAALIGHIARANPLAQCDGAIALVIFAGPDGYVSPSFYPSKAEHGRVVPTWNYVRVEARGPLSIEADPARMRPYIDAPTTHMESHRPAAWTADDAPADFLARLCNGIVGVRIEVQSISGAWKLDQRKTAADRAGASAGLRQEGRADIANLMAEVDTK